MSHKVTFKSEFKDVELVANALTAKQYAFRQTGNVFAITSGPFKHATLDATTGELTGDTDYHSKGELGAFRQAYSEAEFRRQAAITGVTIESRTEANGIVRMVCSSFG